MEFVHLSHISSSENFSFMSICIQIILPALGYSVFVMTTEHIKLNLKNPVGLGIK